VPVLAGPGALNWVSPRQDMDGDVLSAVLEPDATFTTSNLGHGFDLQFGVRNLFNQRVYDPMALNDFVELMPRPGEGAIHPFVLAYGRLIEVQYRRGSPAIVFTMARMDIAWVRAYCLSLPHTTEDVQWENLLFRIARKIYAMVNPEGTGTSLLYFKCTPEQYAELIEMDGIIPAPYMARNHWVSLTRLDALPRAEVRRRILESYQLVFSRLPRKTQRELSGG
jgi:predicted DNA-binding protein (MmcQ/YjbR family)